MGSFVGFDFVGILSKVWEGVVPGWGGVFSHLMGVFREGL